MKENGVPFRTIHSKVKRIEALTGKPVDLDRLLEAARAATQSNRQQPEQDGAAQDTTTAETVARLDAWGID